MPQTTQQLRVTNRGVPRRGRIRHVDWNAHYAKMGVSVASEKKITSLHACDGPSASQCVLSGGKRAFVSRDAMSG